MSLVTLIPLDKDGNPIKKKKKNPTSSRFEQEMDTWQDYHPPRKTEPRLVKEMESWKDYHPAPDLKITKPLGGDQVDPAIKMGKTGGEPDPSKWLETDKHIDPAPMDRGQTKPSDLKIRRETDPAPLTLPGRKMSDMIIGPDTPRYGSTQGDVSNRFGVPKAPQVTTPPNSMFMRSQNAAGVRMKRSKAARSGRSSKGTKQFNRMMSIKSLNL